MLRLSSFVVASVAVHAALMAASRPSPRSETTTPVDRAPVEEIQLANVPDSLAQAPSAATDAPAHAVAATQPRALPPGVPHNLAAAAAPVREVLPPTAPVAPVASATDPVGLNEDDDAPRFVISVGDTASTTRSVSPVEAQDPGALGTAEAPLPEREVDGKARFASGPSPQYPDGARSAGVEGDVRLELVVDPGGAVESARVLRGPGGELDEAALRAARQFHFAPATKAGRPVAVRMPWSMQFRLR